MATKKSSLEKSSSLDFSIRFALLSITKKEVCYVLILIVTKEFIWYKDLKMMKYKQIFKLKIIDRLWFTYIKRITDVISLNIEKQNYFYDSFVNLFLASKVVVP